MASLFISQARSQHISNNDCDSAITMLDTVAKDVEKYYYDPKLHGLDWKATVTETKQKIKSSPSFDAALTHIAQALLALDDSHTLFVPPMQPYLHDYGFREQMIGNRCYVVQVRPGSDAEAKGVKRGDEVLAVGNYQPARETLWMMEYFYGALWPAPGLRLVLRDVQGRQRQVDVMAKFKLRPWGLDLTGFDMPSRIRAAEERRHLQRPRWTEAGNDVGILKLPTFTLREPEVRNLIKRARARQALILDLRGNPGGAADTCSYMLGGVFAKDVKIGDRVGRKGSTPVVAKSWNQRAFAGKLVVLVDSRSASGSEVFARVVQLERRGTILGDRSSGSVMEAKGYGHDYVTNVHLLYGSEISEADIVMSDGKSLEHTGVTPDEVVLPTAADLASGRDPLLSRAAALLGATLTPEDAGRMFPFEWPKE
jgi:carboxyl-terminal processing protease